MVRLGQTLFLHALAVTFGDRATSASIRWRHAQPAFEHSDFFLMLPEFAVHDRCLLGVPRGRFTTASILLGPFDRLVTQRQGFLQPVLPLELFDRLNQLEVVNTLIHASLELTSTITSAFKRFPDHLGLLLRCSKSALPTRQRRRAIRRVRPLRGSWPQPDKRLRCPLFTLEYVELVTNFRTGLRWKL
ncbi:hypothetical protein AC792_13025 [Arthrobacter sp. RIT-PI-e]|nr:hypothetical protein AC792_13025 [Arthrobacter sp. RIT-PI-e]